MNLLDALKRIQELFFQDMRIQGYSLKNSHTYHSLKLSSVSLPPQRRVPQKKRTLSAELIQNDLPKQCCANQKNFSQFLECSLSPERVKNWRRKEYVLGSKRLKKMPKQEDHLSNYRIIQLKEARELFEQTHLWQELIRQKEERHFRITRISN